MGCARRIRISPVSISIVVTSCNSFGYRIRHRGTFPDDSLAYLAYNTQDRQKTKYVLKIIDLEKMTHLSEFIVRRDSSLSDHVRRDLSCLERPLMVQTIESLEPDVSSRLFPLGHQTLFGQTLRHIR